MLRCMGKDKAKQIRLLHVRERGGVVSARKTDGPAGFPAGPSLLPVAWPFLHERVGEKEYKGYDQRVDRQRLDHGETYEHGGHDLA